MTIKLGEPLVSSVQHVRTFELKIPVTGWLEGEIKDWPANVQDQIYEALERMAKKVQLPLTITKSFCDTLHDINGKVDGQQVVVYASEIVAMAVPKMGRVH